ncbi:unnamed protein product [Pleuronectes platessa]|uniref:Uncharacterized protein n=1 Tax=Pleuronectes platessa TaxID=8262 RepID=A0A9N7Z8A9_PLEPL|nr:unnamed protein product [Pleuronectes platessa]
MCSSNTPCQRRLPCHSDLTKYINRPASQRPWVHEAMAWWGGSRPYTASFRHYFSLQYTELNAVRRDGTAGGLTSRWGS